MRDLAMILRALWFRRGTSVAVLLVAAIVIGGAATGPLFLRAAGESVLHDELGSGSSTKTRMVRDRVDGALGDHQLTSVRQAAESRLESLPRLRRLLGKPVLGLQADARASGRNGEPVSTLLAWRADQCHHLTIVRGRCARDRDEVMISPLAGVALQWRVGDSVTVAGRQMRVVGSYHPRSALGDYWAGRPLFTPFLSHSGPDPDAGKSSLDSLFTPLATIEGLPASTHVLATQDRRLRIGAVRLADVRALEREAADYDTDTFIASRLGQATRVVDTLTAPVAVLGAQLLALAWLVLFLVVANGAEARGPEIALAKLRGLSTGSTVTFGLLESLLLVAFATPLGLVAAYAGVWVLARAQLAPGTPVAFTLPTVGVALLAATGAASAAALAASKTLRRPIVEQWRRATRRGRVRTWVVDAIAVVVAVVAVVALLRSPSLAGGGTTSTWALLVPGLVVLAAALVGSRALPRLCRSLFGLTWRRGWLGASLAVRQVARRPGTLRLALVLAVGVGLVAFSVDAWAIGRSNAHDRAWTEVGAAEVLDVQAPPDQDLGDVLDRIDPHGRSAVVSEIADYKDAPPVWLVAVQPQRFARVAFWRPDLGPPMRELTGRIRPHSAVPSQVSLVGDEFAVHVNVDGLSSRGPVFLAADIGYTGGGRAPVTLGRLRPGPQVLRAGLPYPRSFLKGLSLERSPGYFYPISARVQVTGVDVRDQTGWHSTPADLDSARAWRSLGPGAEAPARTAEGLAFTAHAEEADSPGWEVARGATRLPALVTRAARFAGAQDVIGGLDGQELRIKARFVGSSLPGAGAQEVVVDRAAAVASLDGVNQSNEQIWLSSPPSRAFLGTLKKAGVTLLGRTSAAHQTVLYERQGPQLALLLFVYGAGLAGLLAAGACVLTSFLSGRRRTYESVALRAQGLRARSLFLAMAYEQGLLLAFGTLVGAVAGVVGAGLVLPAIPEFADVPAAPPMRYDVHVGLLLGTLVVTLVLLGVVVAVSSLILLRGSRFTQLREAPA